MPTFAIPFGKYAEIAQLVEHNLAKVRVASSSLVFRSKNQNQGHLRMTFILEKHLPDEVSIICSRPLERRLFYLTKKNPAFYSRVLLYITESEESLLSDTSCRRGPSDLRHESSSARTRLQDSWSGCCTEGSQMTRCPP